MRWRADKQRHVQEIAIQETIPAPGADAVKVRHILYSPKDDPDAAQTLPAGRPGLVGGAAGGRSRVREAQGRPHRSSTRRPARRATRRRRSARPAPAASCRTSTAPASFVQGFKDAILKPGLKDGEVLAPFKTEFGWHVVQIMYHPPDSAEMENLRNRIAGGEDFGDDRPRLLGGPRGRHGRRQGLDRPGPDRRAPAPGDLRDAGRRGVADRR